MKMVVPRVKRNSAAILETFFNPQDARESPRLIILPKEIIVVLRTQCIPPRMLYSAVLKFLPIASKRNVSRIPCSVGVHQRQRPVVPFVLRREDNQRQCSDYRKLLIERLRCGS